MLDLRLGHILMEDSGKENLSVVSDGSSSVFTTLETSPVLTATTATAAVSEKATESNSNTAMGELGPPKDLLRERIKNKRAIEGLDDIPSDELFAKKPKYALSQEEKERLLERRKRNKEAAEKSRKKKKDEFEKLQSENDQLAQDKCEMAAMIEKLKKDLQNTTKENQDLKGNLDGLKRWIGKKAQILGLVEPGNKADKAEVTNAGKSVLTRGDPSLQGADNLQEKVGHAVKNTAVSPPSPPQSPPTLLPQPSVTSPPPAHQNGVFKVPPNPSQLPTRSFTPPDDQFHPVGIFTAPRPLAVSQKGHGLQTPWLVDQLAKKAQSQPQDLRMTSHEENDVVITSVVAPSPVKSPQQARVQTAVSLLCPPQRSEDQQIIFLPKDTYFVMDGTLPPYSFAVQGQQITVVSPNIAHRAVDESPEKVEVVEGHPEVTTSAPVGLPASAYATLSPSFAPQVLFSTPMSLPIPLPVSAPGDAIYTFPPRSQVTDLPKVEVQAHTPTPITQLDLHSDPKVMTAIDSLLKLGYKVYPGQAPVSGAPAVTTKAVDRGFLQALPLPSTRSA